MICLYLAVVLQGYPTRSYGLCKWTRDVEIQKKRWVFTRIRIPFLHTHRLYCEGPTEYLPLHRNDTPKKTVVSEH